MTQTIPVIHRLLDDRLMKNKFKYIAANNLCYSDFMWASYYCNIVKNHQAYSFAP